MARRAPLRIAGQRIRAGETVDVRVKISETYHGEPINLPMRILRAKRPGPTVFLTSAIHGDEVNGTGIIRELVFDRPPPLTHGTLVCAPVVNVFGFETHDRYMPDRRDLNRCFPGSPTGSLASRVADAIMREIVHKCDYGIDLHSAGAHRTNFPNVRGDLSNVEVRQLAEAFGCELIVNGKGPEGAFRRAACEAGCPTIVLEAGEIAKFEPGMLQVGLCGIENVLIHLGMMKGTPTKPLYQTHINRTTWVRAELGGLLRFHVRPGDLVEGGQPIATNESVFGEARSVLIAHKDGIVLGMTTYPAVKPGEPVCHIATPRKSLKSIRRIIERDQSDHPYHRLRDELGASVLVTGYVDLPAWTS